MRSLDRKEELEEMISYFPRGRRGKLEVGTTTLAQLLPAPASPRPALLRARAHARCAARVVPAQIVLGDVTDAASIRPAMAGATCVVFTAAGNNYSGQNSPYDVDYLVRRPATMRADL